MMRRGLFFSATYLASVGKATSQSDQFEFRLGHVEEVITFVGGHFCVFDEAL